MNWTVCLSGVIHTDWRQQIINDSKEHGLPITLTSPVTNHEASDAAGDEDIIHPLKEVDASAMALARTPAQVVDILNYVTCAK